MRRIDQPLKQQSERLLSNLLNHGDKSEIATELGVGLSEISQQCNPEEPRASDFYKCKQFLKGTSRCNPSAARLLEELLDVQAAVSQVMTALNRDVVRKGERLSTGQKTGALPLRRQQRRPISEKGFSLGAKPNKVQVS